MSASSGAVRVRSTRASAGAVTLDEAILTGLAPDGGLYLPLEVPALPHHWKDADSLADLAATVLAPWWGPAEHEVAALLRQALDFPVALVELSEDRWLLELFHGPTLSFKDVGARSMARLAGRALAERGGTATVLVATSGDTGSAVAAGFSGIPGVRVAVLYPRSGVSDVQERQLVTARPGVRTFAVEGDFDACQRLVKGAFGDPALRHLGLTSANSINIGRLLPQMLYYLWGALQLQRDFAERRAPYLVVPSGNLGNLTAGRLAAEAGLETAGFLAAHNANRFFIDVLAGRRGTSDVPATIRTRSNAMDVGAPSNFERLAQRYGAELATVIDAVSIDDAATLERMRITAESERVVVCPHTAVALEGLERVRAATPSRFAQPAIVLATAHPAKFPAAVADATGAAPPTAEALEALLHRPARAEPLANDAVALREALTSGDWPG